MKWMIFAALIFSAQVVAATPKLEMRQLLQEEVAPPEIELAPIVILQPAAFMHTLVVDVDLSTIEIFEI